MDGLIFKRNASGHRVARLHYSADPDKNPATENGKKWFETESRKYLGGVNDLKWRQEYEIDFNAGSGELVFPAFLQDRDRFVIDPFLVDETYVLFGGMDWGTRNLTALTVWAVSSTGRKFCVWERALEREAPFEVAKAWHSCPYYRRLQVIWCDPTMFSETVAKKDGFTSIAEMLSDENTAGDYTVDKLAPSHQRSDEACINVFRNAWIKSPPEIQYFRDCPNAIRELCNLKHPERKETVNETEKIVDKDNHFWDSSKYVLLSHPYWQTQTAKPDFGTIGYYNDVVEIAERIARERGTSVQSEFNDLYGQDL